MSKINPTSLRNYLPVTIALILTWLFTYTLIFVKIKPSRPLVTPVEEPGPSTPPAEALSHPAPYLNTLILVTIITISGVILLFLAKKTPRFFRILIGLLIWLVSFGIATLYVISGAMLFASFLTNFWLPISVTVATSTTYYLLRGGELTASTAAAFIASGAGGVLGISLPYWTFLVLIAGISAYDVFAVFKGHLSSLSKKDAPSIRGLAVEVGDVALGLGDLFFYSLTLAASLWNFGLLSAVIATIALIIGYSLVLTLLKKRRLLPGLPIPLLLALAAALLTRNLSI